VIERWLKTIRDHPERPPTVQRYVLAMLALRLDWKTGAGYVSTFQLVADSDVSESTIRRATSWARDVGLLLQTRRGHRLGNGQVAASEWKLTQPVTVDLLTSQPVNGQISTGQQSHLNRSSQPPHQEPVFHQESSPSARPPAADAARADPNRETAAVGATIAGLRQRMGWPPPCPNCHRSPGTGHLPGCIEDGQP
jgi:hypothetical protein